MARLRRDFSYGRSLGFITMTGTVGIVLGADGSHAAGKKDLEAVALLLFCFPALECLSRFAPFLLLRLLDALRQVADSLVSMTVMIIYSCYFTVRE